MPSFLRELRHALRQIRRAPRFSLPAILVLAVGVAANGAILSLSEALLRRPLSLPRPWELFAVVPYDTTAPDSSGAVTFPDYLDYRSRNGVFEGLAAYDSRDLTLRLQRLLGGRGGELQAGTERVSAQVVSDNYFSVLEVRTARGRLGGFEGADAAGPDFEAVLSYGFWQRRFGGDPEVVGETVHVERHPFTVVGIAQQGFRGTDPERPADLWISIDSYTAMDSGFKELMATRGAQMLTCLGRLRSGVARERAEREMAGLASQLARQHPGYFGDWSVVLQPAEHGVIQPRARRNMVHLLGLFGSATGLLLAIVCASVTSLLLAQAMTRGPETAVRLALGAPRRRLLRGFATEYAVVSLLGGGIGLVLARALLAILAAFRPSELFPIAQGFELRMSSAVAASILLLGLLAGAISGVVPVVHLLTVDLRSELASKASGGTPNAGRSRLRSAFVVGQVGLSTVLLIGSGLALESWRGLSAIDLGFDPRGVTVVSLGLDAARYGEASGVEFYERLQERLASRPGVESASLAAIVPLAHRAFMKQIAVDGLEPNSEGWTHNLTGNVVSPGYFRTVGIPLLLGRDFERSDSLRAPAVVIVNETMARTLWPGNEAVGKTFHFVNRGSVNGGSVNRGDEWPVRVVGVASDSWHLRDRRHQRGPHFYLPLAQQYQPSMKLLVKAARPMTEVTEMAAEELRRLDPDLALLGATSFPDLVDASLARERTALALLGATSLIALLLAGLGLYATLSYVVSRRSFEIGLRMALGARPADILAMVLGRGLVLTGLGLALGLGLATRASRLLSGLLYEVGTVELSVYSAVALLVLGLAVLATFVPARRAARVDPAASLMQSS